MTALDRSPSTKSLTETPPGVVSAPSSSPDSDGEDARVRALPSRRGTPRRIAASPHSSNGAARERFSCPSVAVVSLEQHYLTTVQQLERIKSMYCRLDSHNDELESSFVVLRDRLDALRSFLALRLSTTAKELRAEVRLLRETASFQLGEFAENMRRYGKRILARVGQAGEGAELQSLPLATFGRVRSRQTQSPSSSDTYVAAAEQPLICPPASHVHDGVSAANAVRLRGNPRVSRSREALVRSPRPSLTHSPSSRGEAAELWEALSEAVQKREDLEDKMLRQQESYEKHIRSMRELYAQKERTLQRRVELLERALRRDVSGSGFRDDSRRRNEGGAEDDRSADDGVGGSPHSSGPRCRDSFAGQSGAVGPWTRTSSAPKRGSRRARSSSLGTRGPVADPDARAEELCGKVGGGEPGGWGAALDDAPHRSRRSDKEQRRRSSALSAEAAAAAGEPWTLGRDVERRVRSQWLSRSRRGPFDGAYYRHSAPTSRREEEALAGAASRLLDAVTDAYTTSDNPQQRREGRWGAAGGALDEDVVSRLYYVPRSPPRRPDTYTHLSPVPKSGVASRPDRVSDVSRVARGLWAEKLLRERATRQPR
ncbi:uncharacterized protein Tco025E_07392 [Trypanosoma conorhini]|uniref:Uncharacterized protein n=1 Tax=Trypanosoma conorhini TaxID=83891 RepID=A0A422NPI3_9TRYP|nr:uncharacterized protein Tco025E_07392 [Trypanosoma conorhini]RNF07341.1 hypothetical protein Tco025E_07392 [Trypanosoma conorhini]